MSLSDLNSRDAVIRAIREYDRIGRERFLKKHGFRAAKTYYLYFENRYYDSKAITGVAYGYQYPNKGILRSEDFSGGENTVKKKLEELGFEVRLGPMTQKLELFSDYSREDVHSIFAPTAPFVPQTGTWGLQGIVEIPGRPGDFVFFVTLGRQQGDHRFDEGITGDGVLSWQSQPRQGFDNHRIQQFIWHDELENSIYLFFRTEQNRNYTFLGTLKYLAHDGEREKPVYFLWQIMNWPIPDEVLSRMNLVLEDTPPAVVQVHKNELWISDPPATHKRQGVPTHTFQTYKVPDFTAIEAKQRMLGYLGERLVFEYEQKVLTKAGCANLAEKVRHISDVEGDGAGYDILSYTIGGQEKHIEVKTTSGPPETGFFMTSNEVAFSRQHADSYYLYRVYHYDLNNNSGEAFIVQGSIEEAFTLAPSEYRVHYTPVEFD